ncbi:MAG: O-antigen ligase family protein [Candidatus Eremiobacteraeota bacterium]|nr:O-antigen ligase family protein [Candidatus Eremiobacteraeota bacterium]
MQGTFKDRLIPLLSGLFVASLIIIAWGKIQIELAYHISLSIGGKTKCLIFGLFALYLITRLLRRDFQGARSLSDPLTVFTLFCTASLLWATRPDLVFLTDNLLPALLGYYMLRYLLEKGRGDGIEYLRVLVLFVVLLILRGPADATGNFLTDPTVMSTASEHHTITAMIILAVMPVTFALLVMDRSRQWWYRSALVVMFLGMILANSRIGWFTLFPLLLFLLWAFPSRPLQLFCGGLFAFAVLAFLVMFPHLHGRFMTLFNIGHDNDFLLRIQCWQCTFQMIRDHLLLGVGFSVNTFMEHGEKIVPGFMYGHAHNLFLTVLVLTGLVGLALLLWIMVKIARGLIFFKRHAGEAFAPLAAGLGGSFLALFLMNLPDVLLNSCRATLVASLLMAFLFHHCRERGGAC